MIKKHNTKVYVINICFYVLQYLHNNYFYATDPSVELYCKLHDSCSLLFTDKHI